MKQHYPVTITTASTILFVVVLICALATATRSTFTSLQWRFNEAQAAQETQEYAPIITNASLAENLSLVFNISKQVGDPETLQAILLQETNGGRSELIGNKNSPVGKRSYGLMQLQVCAAREVLERNPDLFKSYFPGRKYSSVADEEVIALLLTNRKANVTMAAYHFKYYKKLAGGDWDKTVAGYNAGVVLMLKIKHPEEFGYVKDIRQKLTSTVRPFNREHGLQLTPRF
jgi:hypothetical protein